MRQQTQEVLNSAMETGNGGATLHLKRTGIVKDTAHAGHCMGPGALEGPERLDALLCLLEEPEFRGRLIEIPPRMAARTELESVHSPEYIRRLEETAEKPLTYLDSDTLASRRSNEVASLAAGGLCRAIEEVCAGDVDNAFALVRPPGHHAEREMSGGFCLYNNVAIGARFAQSVLGLRRILIVDWDLHHGNGTQHCFDEDPSVLFFSTHQAFTYPYTGGLKESGKGDGKGYTVNVPLPPGWGDGEYLALWNRVLKPVTLSFQPDVILVSAGFDIHFNDPLGGMRVTPRGFAAMTRILLDLADACCEGRLVMTLEGGYDPEGLKDSVREVLKEMTGLRVTEPEKILPDADDEKIGDVLWRVNRVHRDRWKSLPAMEPPDRWNRMKRVLSRWRDYLNS